MKVANLFLTLACVAVTRATLGQAIPDALFTSGTTTTDEQNRPWAYLAFRYTDEQVLAGRSLAVYLKNGLPGDPGSFVRQGTVAAEVDVSVLAVLLDRSRKLGENLGELDSVLYEVYRTRTGDKNSISDPLPAPPKPALPEMLSSLLVRATADAETSQLMRVLGQAHPAVKMALGEAWAGPLTAAPGQPVTLEVREWSTAGDGGVVGRVTLTAGQPVLLPAPGPPVQVPDLTPKGDLNVRLRWGQDDDLRRQSPLSSGFNVWRVLRSFAAANGVENTAPSLNQLNTWRLAGDAVRANERAVLVERLMTPAEAANLNFAKDEYFLTDDGRRYRLDGDGQPMNDPLIEGTRYTYFVTSRDTLGRDGPPSLPGHAIVCRTLPPPVPGDLRVENLWEPSNNPNAATGTQTLQFFWRANTNNALDVTDFYEVYRGTDLRELESTEGKNGLNPRFAGELHQVNGALMSVIDDDPAVLTSNFGDTFWYSVRAVHVSPLGHIKSDFAAPVMIARRQREGPPAPSGHVDLNCPRASVIALPQSLVTDPTLTGDEMLRVRLVCVRLDRGIASADLSVRHGSTIIDLGQHLFPADDDTVAADYEIAHNQINGETLTAICQTTTHTGRESNPKEDIIDTHASGQYRRQLTFHTKTLGDADLVPGEVFSNELLEASISAGAGADPNGVGIVVGLPAALEDRTVIIQTSATGGAFVSWATRGHAKVRGGVAWFTAPVLPEGQQHPAVNGQVFAVRDFGIGGCVDLASNPGTGKAGKLQVTLFTTPRTEEYRLFRRINDGPYTQVAQGQAKYAGASPINAVRRDDDGLPSTDCTICYYAQTVDRDGNASAMVRLEPCIERKSFSLPRPRLSPPVAGGTAESAKMKLTWMCPPQGVERFLISVKARGGPAAQSTLESFSTFALTSPLAARVVYYHSSDSDLKVTVGSQAAGPVGQASNPNQISVVNVASTKMLFEKFVNLANFITPPLGNGFPAEPPFTAEFDVQPGVSYTVYVQAVRGVVIGGKGRGPASASYTFDWGDPAPPEPAVSWPARPMPEVTSITAVQAGEADPILWPAHLNGQRPVGVRLAQLVSHGTEDFVMAAGEVVYAPYSGSKGYGRHNPNAQVIKPIGDGTRQAQGVVLYRQQVANSVFPTVSGDTIQVSPLVRQIAWIPTMLGNRFGARLIDPYFAVTHTVTNGDEINSTLDLWLLDNQGVVNLARYHYYLVCFGADGEITQTVDAGFYGPN